MTVLRCRKNKKPGTDRGVHGPAKGCAKTYNQDKPECLLEERLGHTHQQRRRQARDSQQRKRHQSEGSYFEKTKAHEARVSNSH